MRKKALGMILAILLLWVSCIPVMAAGGLSPDVGVRETSGGSGSGTASGGSVIGVLSSKGGVILDPTDPKGANKYVVILVMDEKGNLIEGATTQIVAIQSGEARTNEAVTNAAGEAVMASYWNKSYYFYGFMGGYTQLSPVVNPPTLTLVKGNEGADSGDAYRTAENILPGEVREDEGAGSGNAVVTIVLQKYTGTKEPSDQMYQTVKVTTLRKENGTDIVTGAKISVTFETTVDGVKKEITLYFISNENGEFNLILPTDVTEWSWTADKPADTQLKAANGKKTVSGTSAEIYFSTKSDHGGSGGSGGSTGTIVKHSAEVTYPAESENPAESTNSAGVTESAGGTESAISGETTIPAKTPDGYTPAERTDRGTVAGTNPDENGKEQATEPFGEVTQPEETEQNPEIPFGDCTRHTKMWVFLFVPLYLAGRLLMIKKDYRKLSEEMHEENGGGQQ